MLTLGIESTCDETAASVVCDGKILSNVVSSQIDLHTLYGGVVPELACRRHIDCITQVIQKAVSDAKTTLQDIDVIAVAHGPGLIGAILIGLNAAKALAYALKKPLVCVNHVEAHLYAAIMEHPQLQFPALGLVLSGGHSSLIEIQGLGSYKLLGQTVDDAIGETFDKVATLLGLSYPGGPAIEKLASTVTGSSFTFPKGQVKNRPLDFSFSGLKTAALYAIKGQGADKHAPIRIAEEQKAEVAYAFQEAAFDAVLEKTRLAWETGSYKSILLGGGVTNNRRLRQRFEQAGLPTYFPPFHMTLDNAAMIAGLGEKQYLLRGSDSLSTKAQTRIAF